MTIQLQFVFFCSGFLVLFRFSFSELENCPKLVFSSMTLSGQEQRHKLSLEQAEKDMIKCAKSSLSFVFGNNLVDEIKEMRNKYNTK